MDDRNEPIELTADFVKKETARAVLIEIDGAEHWIPFSQIAEGAEDLNEGEEGVSFSIPRWLAEERGLA